MKTKSKKSIIILIVVIIAIIAACAGAYFWGKNYFSTHFFPGTTINGRDVGGKTIGEVKKDMQGAVQDYTLVVKERNDLEDKVTGYDLGFTYKDDGGVEEILAAQNSDFWILSVANPNIYNLKASYSYDKSVIDSVMNGFKCFKSENVIAPEDAKLIDNGVTFEIAPELEGATVDRSKLKTALIAAIEKGDTLLDCDKEGVYVEPQIRSDDQTLNKQKDQVNQLVSANITYDFQDRQIVCDGTKIREWLVKDAEGNYSVSRDGVFNFVYNMAYETDTFGLEHQFVTTTGETITLASGGDYGWCINQDPTTDQLLQAILAGQVTTLEPIYLYQAMSRTQNDIGDSYVEICIESQTMWCYKNGELVVQTPVVTGGLNKGFSTPSGSVWAIDSKKDNWHFSIFNLTVKYWLPFNGDCGIHESSWRGADEYGGTTYIDNGSHGCINTPEEACGKIFDAMEIGYPVIVYYSTSQVVGPAPTQEVTAG